MRFSRCFTMEIPWKSILDFQQEQLIGPYKGGNHWTRGLPTSLIGKSYQGEGTENGDRWIPLLSVYGLNNSETS